MSASRRYSRPLLACLLALLALLALGACGRPAASATAPAWEPPAMPDTPAGRQAAGFLEVFNAGDQDALAAFVGSHMTPVGPGGGTIEDSKRNNRRLYEISRGLNVYRVEASHENELTVLAQLRLTQEWRRMTFYVEAEPPHLISGIRMEPAPAPVTAGPASDEELGKALDAYVRGLADAGRFSGVVLVARGGQPIFEGAYGLASVEEQAPNTMETRFNIASAGKMFTAVAVAQLVEQGRLAYDAPLAAYLPDYQAGYARELTIDQLLTHRTGIVDFLAEPKLFAGARGDDDYLRILQGQPLRFAPGERFEYSNSNYLILGAVIARVSGQPYADYIREHVFAPAGMAATTFEPDAPGLAPVARGYTELADMERMEFTPGTRRPADTFGPVGGGGAAGGAFSTAGDLLSFAQALRGHGLLGAEATEQLLADRAEYERPGYRYAYGFITREAGDERIVGHSGGYIGVDAQVDIYLDDGYTVVVLSNYELVGESVAMWLQQALAGR